MTCAALGLDEEAVKDYIKRITIDTPGSKATRKFPVAP